jgi:hypothetical protein
MTMHLAKGYSSLNTASPKPKYTKANLKKWADMLVLENRTRKQQGLDRISLDQFIDYLHGIAPKPEKKVETYKPGPARRVSDLKKYPSVTSTGPASCAKTEPLQYTGERKLLGIATMHKSNAVPVFADDAEYAKDLARMRRG